MLPWVVQQHGGHGCCETGCGYCRGCRRDDLGRDGRKLLRKVAGKGTALIAFKVNKGREELGDFFAAFREKGGGKIKGEGEILLRVMSHSRASAELDVL